MRRPLLRARPGTTKKEQTPGGHDQKGCSGIVFRGIVSRKGRGPRRKRARPAGANRLRGDIMALRQHYWNPRMGEQCFVDETHFLYPFNRKQDAGTWSDLHVHPTWGELTYVASGSIVMCTGTGNVLGQSCRAIWVPPGIRHEWYMPESSSNRTLFIHPSVFADKARFRRYQAIELTPLLRELIFAVADLQLDLAHPTDRRLGQVLVDRLERAKEIGTPLLMPSEHRLVELCARALQAPDEPVRLADWSRQLGMSEKTLARMFIRQTGQTFGRWLSGMRLQHALAEIEEGQSVTAVALNCGYSSISAFIAAFKKQFGKTPGALARRQENDNAAERQARERERERERERD